MCRLLTSGISPKCTAMQAIGYKEFTQALSGEMTAADFCRLTGYSEQQVSRARRRLRERQPMR